MVDEDLLHDDAGDNRESADEKLARYMGRPDAAKVQAETNRAGAKAGKGFKCPECHGQNFRVLETRSRDESKTRRRECRCCGYRFTTLEVPVS